MNDVDKIKQNLQHYKEKVRNAALKVIAEEADKSIKLNHQEQGRPGKWKKKVFDDGRSILTGKSGALLARTTPKISFSESKVTIGNTLVYGKIHNEGGKINITSKMRSFFWFKYYSSGGGVKGKEDSAVSLIWKRMALKKDSINMPERRYLFIPESDYPRILRNTQKVVNSITI